VGAGRGKARGPKLEAQRAEPGMEFPGKPPPHQLGGLGSAVSFPSGVLGEAPAAKSFGSFWFFTLQVSSPAVLLLDLGVMNRDL